MEQYPVIKKKFERMGARLKIRFADSEPRFKRVEGFRLDVGNDKKGEYFDLLIGEGDSGFAVTDLNVKARHLLLMADFPSFEEDAEDGDMVRAKFLCGHDERHWFIAGVPEHVSNVSNAMEALKPEEVRISQGQNHVIPKNRHRRRNKGFLRQGEWYFVPAPDLKVDENAVVRSEPISRGGGKSHWVHKVYREGGTKVYVCHKYPQGVSHATYSRLLRDDPDARKYAWREMYRDAVAYARGSVRHPDHKTIYLNGWHRIFMNNEVVANTGNAVQQVLVFLD